MKGSEIDRRGKEAHRKWLEKYYPDVAAKSAKKKAAPVPDPKSTPGSDDGTAQRAAELAAFEAVLQRTEAGRRCLTIMDSIAQKTIRIDLTRELERSAEQDLARLRRILCGSDLIEREKAAGKIRYAEAELRKWRNSRVAYENERDRLRYALADVARALSL